MITEHRKAIAKKTYLNNRLKILNKAKLKYRLKHPVVQRIGGKRLSVLSPEELKRRRNERTKLYYLAHKAELNAKHNERWRKNHPLKPRIPKPKIEKSRKIPKPKPVKIQKIKIEKPNILKPKPVKIEKPKTVKIIESKPVPVVHEPIDLVTLSRRCIVCGDPIPSNVPVRWNNLFCSESCKNGTGRSI